MQNNNNNDNKISRTFRALSEKEEHALICYVLPGYPNAKASTALKIVSTMVEAGADIIEVGIPFSDPIADGPVIQEALYQSLNNGINPDECLRVVSKIRKKFSELPIVAITYYNILYKRGLNSFLKQSMESGIDGFIVPDIPIEHCSEYVSQASKLGLATPFLVSPNTSEHRLRSIASMSSGFLYVVSVYGTTGMRKSFEKYTFDNIRSVKRIINSKNITTTPPIPIIVGFGINTPEHVKLILDSGVDGIIVASKLVDKIKESRNNEAQMLQQIKAIVSSMKKACKEQP
ncbi:MAG TPA: tryptophan synthase subunit alpha [Nitrososphaeraceae archaeon]|nr:tryptophan synthase subunit alpha [Nitrososphaeraceae archaeon]